MPYVQIKHLFDLKAFPFDSHKLKVDYRINKLPFRDIFDLRVRDCGLDFYGDPKNVLVDPNENIPYYEKNEDNPPCIDEMKKEQKVAALEFDPWLSAGPEFDLMLPTEIENQDAKQKPRVAFTIEIRRISVYHVWNMAVESAISTIVFALVVIKTGDFRGRLATNVTVLFTLISFSNSRSSSLPKLPYGTYAGRHTFRCLLMVISLIVANIFVAKRARRSSRPRRQLDRAIYRNAGIAWAAYNAWLLACWLYFVVGPRLSSTKYVPLNREEGTPKPAQKPPPTWKTFWEPYPYTEAFLLFLLHLIV